MSTPAPNVSAPPDASEIFVDVDWLRGSGAAPCLYVHEGALRASWDDNGQISVEGTPTIDVAGRVLTAIARRALSAVSTVTGSVEVIGDGAVAALVRGGVRAREDSGPPAAVIDCVGDVGAIEDALRRLDDLGTLVVAGVSTPDSLTIDLYPDLHVRSLRLVGVDVLVGDEMSLDRGMPPEVLLTTLCDVGAGGVEEGCTWLRFRSARE